MNHTPGPWRVEGPFGPVPTIGDMEIVGNSGATVASIPRGPDARYVERQANARLIAQAPAMLALVRDVANNTLGRTEADCSEDRTGTCMFHHENHNAERRQKARAILRAVEGEPS